MPTLWNFFRRKSETPRYDFWKLIDSTDREPFQGDRHPIQIICDIDKTYLETEFESILKMARVALESANLKVTVLGAADILELLRWGDQRGEVSDEWPRPLHFVSSSPPQLRPVLEEKLMLDGLDWTTDTFKNQAYNLIKGRMDLLSHHVAYKSAAILRIMKSAGGNAEFWMLGDNAESDAYIYCGVALYCEGILDAAGYHQYLSCAGVDNGIANDIIKSFPTAPQAKVGGILIRNAPGYRFIEASPLTDHVQRFDHYLDAYLGLLNNGLVGRSLLTSVVRDFHNRHGFSLDVLRSSLQRFAMTVGIQMDWQSASFSATLDQLAASTVSRCNANRVRPLPEISANACLELAGIWAKRIHEEKRARKDRRVSSPQI